MKARHQVPAIIAAIVMALPAAAVADELAGRARVVDGDSLVVEAIRIRLHGIDAPELQQHCHGQRRVPMACGEMARSALRGLIASNTVHCVPETRDRYHRIVAVCRVGELDLGREMVRLGWARAFLQYSDRYLAQESDARAAGRGLWGGTWDPPAEWRRSRRD